MTWSKKSYEVGVGRCTQCRSWMTSGSSRSRGDGHQEEDELVCLGARSLVKTLLKNLIAPSRIFCSGRGSGGLLSPVPCARCKRWKCEKLRIIPFNGKMCFRPHNTSAPLDSTCPRPGEASERMWLVSLLIQLHKWCTIGLPHKLSKVLSKYPYNIIQSSLTII
jgi:hypothetical protein